MFVVILLFCCSHCVCVLMINLISWRKCCCFYFQTLKPDKTDKSEASQWINVLKTTFTLQSENQPQTFFSVPTYSQQLLSYFIIASNIKIQMCFIQDENNIWFIIELLYIFLRSLTFCRKASGIPWPVTDCNKPSWGVNVSCNIPTIRVEINAY